MSWPWPPTVVVPEATRGVAPDELRILHRDEHLVAVHKPSGLAVHRSAQVRDRDVAMTHTRDLLGRKVYPVHRLDRGTSGVLLFALDAETAAAVQRRFEAGTVEKRYLALTRGVPDDQLLDHPVPKARKSKERLDAVTEIRVLDVGESRWAWLEAKPRTGRTHQIRRHLKHLSCPIVGDVHYGKGDVNRLFRRRFGLHRLALHAESIGLEHPATGERLEVRSEVPVDLRAVLEGLEIPIPPS